MYKDTAKWLLAFVPITTLVGLGLAFVPNVDAARAQGAGPWLTSNWLFAVSVTGVGLAAAVIVAMCLLVLVAGPSTWSTVRNDEDWLSNAFSKFAVGRPYFLDSSAFVAAEEGAIVDGEPDEREAVALVTMRVLELSTTLNERQRFRNFAIAYAIGILVIVTGSVAAVLVAPSEAIVQAQSVNLVMTDAAWESFDEQTGCAGRDADVVAVGGTWEDPTLRVFGAECTDADWSPRDLDFVVIPE